MNGLVSGYGSDTDEEDAPESQNEEKTGKATGEPFWKSQIF